MRLHPALALTFLAVPLLPAQSLAPTAGPAPARDEVVELSPFQVSAEAFQGYYASQTLAGSRLRMNVDEIASSVQIVTPEFMRDVGVRGSTSSP